MSTQSRIKELIDLIEKAQINEDEELVIKYTDELESLLNKSK